MPWHGVAYFPNVHGPITHLDGQWGHALVHVTRKIEAADFRMFIGDSKRQKVYFKRNSAPSSRAQRRSLVVGG